MRVIISFVATISLHLRMTSETTASSMLSAAWGAERPRKCEITSGNSVLRMTSR